MKLQKSLIISKNILIKKYIKYSEYLDSIGRHECSDRAVVIAQIAPVKISNTIPKVISDLFLSAGAKIYAVGGCVRDTLLNQKPKDIDLCTDLTPDEVISLCESKRLRVIPTGIEHGTVTVLANNDEIEITTFRADLESDGRHAKVGFVKDINEDLARRDFTINAMAADNKGNIIDPFNGLQDLTDGVIRAVGDPQARFSEDYLRIIRAARFASRYGFQIEPETARAMQDMAPNLVNEINIDGNDGKISVERITDEFNKCFKTSNSKQFIDILYKLGVLTKLIPSLTSDVYSKFKETSDKIPQQYRWCALFMWMNPNEIEPTARRFKMPLDILPLAKKCAEIRPMVEAMVAQPEFVEPNRRRFQTICGAYIEPLADIFESLYNGSDIITYIFDKSIERFSPIVQGRDLLIPGKKPGRWVGDAQRKAEDIQREHWIEHGINPEKQYLIDKALQEDQN